MARQGLLKLTFHCDHESHDFDGEQRNSEMEIAKASKVSTKLTVIAENYGYGWICNN